MLFNDLLKQRKIKLGSVLALRHTPKKLDGELRKHLPWLAAVRPELFNAYQQTQGATVEKEMLEAKYVASFIGIEKRLGSKEHAAVFVGLYKIGANRPLTYEQFWQVAAFQD